MSSPDVDWEDMMTQIIDVDPTPRHILTQKQIADLLGDVSDQAHPKECYE